MEMTRDFAVLGCLLLRHREGESKQPGSPENPPKNSRPSLWGLCSRGVRQGVDAGTFAYQTCMQATGHTSKDLPIRATSLRVAGEAHEGTGLKQWWLRKQTLAMTRRAALVCTIGPDRCGRLWRGRCWDRQHFADPSSNPGLMLGAGTYSASQASAPSAAVNLELIV